MGNNKQKKNEAAEPATSLSTKMSGKDFEKKLAKLQVELVRLQTWVQAKKARVIVVFEGRDTAGKGGVISRITERTSPRVFRHVALPTPSDRQKSQVYMQRYLAQFPAAGEIILFDRSWYNRAGVERVMGFCTDEQYERFLELAPVVEREIIVKNGIFLRKYFLDVSQDEQRRRFAARIDDPVKHWKLSPMDTESVRRWNRRSCAPSETENQYLTRIIPQRSSMRSNSGQARRNSWYSSSVQKPITRSTPARLYQLRSMRTISPAAGRWDT